jgi:hypothetical protein
MKRKKMGFGKVLSRVQKTNEGTFEHGKKLSFSFYDTKAKSIIATREFNAIDNSAYTVFMIRRKQGKCEGD